MKKFKMIAYFAVAVLIACTAYLTYERFNPPIDPVLIEHDIAYVMQDGIPYVLHTDSMIATAGMWCGAALINYDGPRQWNFFFIKDGEVMITPFYKEDIANFYKNETFISRFNPYKVNLGECGNIILKEEIKYLKQEVSFN